MTDALLCLIHLLVCLWILETHSRAPKKNTSHWNEVLSQDTHLLQRPCYQWGSPCQDPAGNWTTWRPPDGCKETQTAVVWPCFLFIRSCQNHLARHSERGKETRWTKEEVGRQHQGNGQAWSSSSPRRQWRTGKKWRKLAAKSSMVSQRPSRLRDWWDEKWERNRRLLSFQNRGMCQIWMINMQSI